MKEARPLLSVPALTVGLSWLPALATLFKVRIVALLLLAATAGAFLGAEGLPGLGPLAVLMVMGALAAGGSSLLNDYLERDLDARMRRTRHRPLVTGVVPRSRWLATAGVAMVAVPVALTALFNPPLAASIALGPFVYLVVYTLWLKPRTPPQHRHRGRGG